MFFDTFPIREDPFQETQANIDAFEKINALVDKIGKEEIGRVIAAKDGVQVSKLVLDMLR